MKNMLIGRNAEIEQLRRFSASGKAEFVAIYGRRRVGKTFLVNNVFANSLTFSMTGILDGDRKAQIHAFCEAMELAGNPLAQKPKDWYEAFQILRRFLHTKQKNREQCIVFIDELPSFDTHRSDFVKALGFFWNSWASLQNNFMLIVCGSSTSWMMENIIDSHGGLHDRITHEMHIKEFSLKEVEAYLNENGFFWDRLIILQAYMVFGGIPYYYSLLSNEDSLAQNIDRLLFSPHGEMRHEFTRLYKTLFSKPEPYISIIEALFKRKEGLSMAELAQTIGKTVNGRLSNMLNNLVDCDIIHFNHIKNKKISKRNGIFQLTDFFSCFYLQFMKDGNREESFWSKSSFAPEINTWRGLTFESVCKAHITQIKEALRIGGIRTSYYSWRSNTDINKQKAQIDLIIERADKTINICEIKYSESPYILTKEEYSKLRSRTDAFIQQTAFKGGIIPIFITVCGLQKNTYSEYIPITITLDQLFT